MNATINVLLWGAGPYITIAVLVVGTGWRYRYDKFGWTSRSSQSHESRILKIASPVFHFGLLMVIGGHILGLLIPESLTQLLGITESDYHAVSLGLGSLAGVMAIGGLAVLIYRRLRTPAVRGATSRSDQIVYVVLAAALVIGLTTTILDNGIRGGYDYRMSVAPWFRGIFYLHPQPSLMAGAPFDYKLHAGVGMLLFILWPFSRLVHAFSAPVQYLFRPYIVYRSRRVQQIGTRLPDRGWEPHADQYTSSARRR